MGARYIKQCDVFPKPYLSTHVIDGGRPTSPSVVRAVAPAHPFSTTSTWKIGSNRGREATNSHLRSGLLLRSEGDANDRSSMVQRSVKCEACTGRKEKMADYSYDLYELLGIEKDARAEDIKRAYRWLQKRCHPDIAGPGGHDMAILLNDAYSVLSDPGRRASYDATCAENEQFAGYTGNPLYSTWYGKPGEERAVFVEETRCIGCLKCALIAPNTFAIELKHGRARAVGQWLDDEGTVKDAIRACPVDCISWVDKNLLPALEFIMSKQPRLPVAINNYSYVGVRQESVFLGADRFLQKYAKRKEESQSASSEETPAQREARMAAEKGIHIKAGHWWHDLTGFTFNRLWDRTTTRISQGALIPISSVRSSGKNQFVDNNGPEKYSFNRDADLGPLFEAARRRRSRGTSASSKGDSSAVNEEEYWTPAEPISCPLPLYTIDIGKVFQTTKTASSDWVFDPLGRWSASKVNLEGKIHAGLENLISIVPIAISVAAAVLVGMNGGSDVARSETGLISGPLPASITSGVVMQIFLTAIVWYMIGALICAGALLMTSAFITLREKKNKGRS